MEQQLISVIMAAFNGEKYISSAIESILSQTLGDFELIIVDDGSTDSTGNIINQFRQKDKRIRPLFNESNLGLTKSLNAALGLARGTYIARMDADDVSDPHRFEKQVEFLDRHKDYAVVGTKAIIIDEAGRPTGEINPPLSYRAIRERFPVKNAFVHSSVMFLNECILRVGGYDEAFSYAQDYEMWCRMLLFYKGANLNRFLHRWRRSREGVSSVNRRLQKVFSDAVRGRYGSLYRTLQDRDIAPWDKKETFYCEMLENARLGGNDPLYRFLYHTMMNSKMPARKKIAVLNRAVGDNNMCPVPEKIRLLEAIRGKNELENYQLASLYKRQEMHGKAKRIFEKLTESRDKIIKAGAYFHLGEMALRAGRQEEAVRAFRNTVRYNPYHFKAENYLEK